MLNLIIDKMKNNIKGYKGLDIASSIMYSIDIGVLFLEPTSELIEIKNAKNIKYPMICIFAVGEKSYCAGILELIDNVNELCIFEQCDFDNDELLGSFDTKISYAIDNPKWCSDITSKFTIEYENNTIRIDTKMEYTLFELHDNEGFVAYGLGFDVKDIN